MLQFVIFIGIVLVVLGPLHWYLYRRLIKDTTRPGRARKIGAFTIVGLATVLLAAFMLPRVIGAKESYAVSLVGYMWLAVMFYLIVILLVLELPLFIGRRVIRAKSRAAAAESMAQSKVLVDTAGTPVPPQGPDGSDANGPDADEPAQREAELSRRLLLSRSAAIFAGLTATGIVGYGVKTALGDPVLKRVQFSLPKLPASMDGYRIAVVSDIHIGPLTGIEHTRRIVRSINGMDADLIAVVGDLVDGSVAELGSEAAPLAQLRSKDGTFFVTGNHEYFSGVGEWLEEVERLGMRTLQNERVEVQGIDLAGVNDVTGITFDDSGPDFAKALGDRDPAKPVILLAHQPIQAFEAAKYGVDLQLSGHTHGGQMVPFNYIAALQQPVISGMGEVDGVPVYVTNGAGFWGPPVRVGAPPDITLLELRAG